MVTVMCVDLVWSWKTLFVLTPTHTALIHHTSHKRPNSTVVDLLVLCEVFLVTFISLRTEMDVVIEITPKVLVLFVHSIGLRSKS